MEERRNLQWHRACVAEIVNYQDGTPDQDSTGPTNYTWKKIDAALNEAARQERNEAIIHGSSEAFRKKQSFTWASGELTFTLPSYIDRESVMEMHDVTDDTLGQPIHAMARGFNRLIFWLDNKTLQWGTTGASRDTTVEISYAAAAPSLSAPTAEYDVFPYSHRDLINWSAACIWADMADQEAPASWEKRRDGYRSSFHLAISRGSPTSYGAPRIRNHRATR